ncbi:hypothetical protein [Dyella sp. AD56]|uniref:hypothetical protein n=1 Tax=Dyella sp. AD56 TaxID=1528744 RepID=UPI0011AFA4AC|nr:hypothetical protein [Dyella sp. AD56]
MGRPATSTNEEKARREIAGLFFVHGTFFLEVNHHGFGRHFRQTSQRVDLPWEMHIGHCAEVTPWHASASIPHTVPSLNEILLRAIRIFPIFLLDMDV